MEELTLNSFRYVFTGLIKNIVCNYQMQVIHKSSRQFDNVRKRFFFKASYATDKIE